ncbi:MAG TPA: sigma-70 family RNA polymerase sigma factor [Sphingomicrobium sp.]|nr:sigma-70 family RNA polymerase sigma factor [Sphingomicrobium sp.]
MAVNASRVLDEYLLASIRAGDRAALELLARRWQRKLLAHAWRLLGGDAEAARDAVQEGWVEIVNGLSRLRDDRAFPAWAHRIVSRRCARQIDAAVHHRRLAAETEFENAVEPTQNTGPDSDRLRRAIRALPPEQRAAIALFHFEELSIAEVAVALDVPAGTVKTRLMHARRKLRDALGGDE